MGQPLTDYMDFAQQFTAVVGVLGLLAAVALVAHKRGFTIALPTRSSQPRRMESVERLSLTPNHSLHLVVLDGKTVLVAVSPSGCQLLEERA